MTRRCARALVFGLALLLASCAPLTALVQEVGHAAEQPRGGAICVVVSHVWGLLTVKACRSGRPGTRAVLGADGGIDTSAH